MRCSRRLAVLLCLYAGFGCTSRLGFGPSGDTAGAGPGGDANPGTPGVCTSTPISAADNTVPSVTITSPTGGTIGSVVTVTATASDDTYLVGVRFYLDDVLLGAEDNVAPYTHSLDTTALVNGTHILRAVARDGAQNLGTDSLTVSVDNPQPSGGITYYACDCLAGASAGCVAGNDSDLGTSPANAVASGQAIQSLLDATDCGDAMLLCRGGSFEHYGSLTPPPRTCSGNPIRIGAYTLSGAGLQSPRPIVRFIGTGHGINIQGGINPRVGIIVEDLHLICGNCVRGDARTGVYLLDAGAAEIVIRRLEIEDFDWGFYALGNIDVTLEYSHIHHIKSRGTTSGAAALVVRYNLFENNGCIDAATDMECENDWNVAFGTGINDPGIVFVGNEITRTSVDSQGRCSAASFYSGTGGIGAVYSHNYIHEPPGAIGPNCVGMFFYPAASWPQGCTDCRVFSNRIENTTGGIVVASTPRIEIFNNTIALGNDGGTSTACVGIAAFPQTGAEDLETTEIRIYNNSIYLGRDGMVCGGVSLADTGQNHVIVNNLIYYTGQAPNFDCFVVIDPTQVATMDHNVCIAERLTPTPWARTGATRFDFAAWKAAQSFDASSTDAGVAFATPESPFFDLRLAACSDAVALTGDAASCPALDYGGAARTGATCVIGAFAGP